MERRHVAFAALAVWLAGVVVLLAGSPLGVPLVAAGLIATAVLAVLARRDGAGPWPARAFWLTWGATVLLGLGWVAFITTRTGTV